MVHDSSRLRHRQRGASVIEFAFVAIIFLSLLFGIVEFSRLFFDINSVQEITRRAGRDQVVRWISAGDTDAVQRAAMLQPGSTGTVYYPGAIDINNSLVQLSYYNTYTDAVNQTNPISYSSSSTSQANLDNCLLGNPNCIRFVRATLSNGNGSLVNFNTLAPFMPSSAFPLPDSTVIMPAEALGLS